MKGAIKTDSPQVKMRDRRDDRRDDRPERKTEGHSDSRVEKVSESAE